MNLFKRIVARTVFGVRSVDLAGSQNIFGTLGTGALPILTTKNFIPKDNGGGTIQLTGEGDRTNPVWLGLDTKMMQWWAYNYCSPLATVIDRLAEADTNGLIQFVDSDNMVPVKNSNKNPKLVRIKRLLKKPNPWQTWEEFDGEQIVLCKIFGYCPVFAVGPAGFDKTFTKAFININPILVNPIRNENFTIFGNEGRIKEWHLNIFGKTYILPAEDILLVKDGFAVNGIDDLGLPISKILGMDFFISNICAAMEADNVILKKKGPLGIFSYDPAKDMAGSTPLDPNGKDELQADLARYGLTIGQIQYVISKMPVKWNAMSFNLRDLMTKETVRTGIDGICDRFSYPAELMSGKNATYENRTSSEKWLYNNNIMPYSLRRMTRYNNFFDLEDVIINKTFNHLDVLQEDIVKSGEARKYETEGLQIEWTSGMITWNQWQIEQEREPVDGMDIYYPEYIKKFPSMDVNKVKQDGKNTPPKNSGSEK